MFAKLASEDSVTNEYDDLDKKEKVELNGDIPVEYYCTIEDLEQFVEAAGEGIPDPGVRSSVS